jgi:hypothetical protein
MRLALTAVLLLAPALAFAQPKPSTDAHDMAASDCARARKLKQTCVLTIGAEDIEGGAVKPDGLDITARDRVKFGSLVRIRAHFIPEILKSANDLD